MTLDQAVNRAIEQKQHILLTGQGGDGKTTLLLDWWNRHARSSELLALHVNLRTLRRTGRGIESVTEYLIRVFCGDAGAGENDRTREETLLRTLEVAGCPLVLLLDGLDEAAEQQTVVGEIIALAERSELKTALTMVVASRYIPEAMKTEDGKALLPVFVQYRCSPLAFSDEQLSRLAGRSAATMSPALKQLLLRPMYLALYRKYRLDQAEGDEANELDSAALLLRAARRRLLDFSRKTGQYERVRYILEEVLPALAYRNRNRLSFEETEFCREIEQANSKCRDLGKLYDDVIMGVLVPKGIFSCDTDGHGSTYISWSHKNWAEYFAAEHVINRMRQAEQNGSVPDELLAMRENPMPMVGELLGEHRFRDKTECRSDNQSPLEAYMQRNYAGKMGKRVARAVSACVKLMRMARNDKICADYSRLDTTKCVFIGSTLGKSVFKEAIIQRESFLRPDPLHGRYRCNGVNACSQGNWLINYKTGETRDISHLNGCRAFSIDARYFAGYDTSAKTIEVYLTRDPETEPMVLCDVPERVEKLYFSGDGAKLFAQHHRNMLRIWELGEPQRAPFDFAPFDLDVIEEDWWFEPTDYVNWDWEDRDIPTSRYKTSKYKILSPSPKLGLSHTQKTVCSFTGDCSIVKVITGARDSFSTADSDGEDAMVSSNRPQVLKDGCFVRMKRAKFFKSSPQGVVSLLKKARRNKPEMLTAIGIRALVSAISPWRMIRRWDEEDSLLVKGRLGFVCGKRDYLDFLFSEERGGVFEFPDEPKRIDALAHFDEGQRFLAYMHNEDKFVMWGRGDSELHIWHGDPKHLLWSDGTLRSGGVFVRDNVRDCDNHGAVLSFARETFSTCQLFPLQGDGDPDHPQFYCAIEDGYTIRIYTSELEDAGSLTCIPVCLGGADFTGADFGGDDAFRDIITQNGGICE